MSKEMMPKWTQTEAGQASPFAVLVAALLGILVLALACTGGTVLLRSGQEADLAATSTAIAQVNATTLAQNARVTQTIAAMETEAARPTATATSTPRPTNTATATSTPEPTATPTEEVVVEGEETPTPNFFGTSIFDGAAGTPAAPGGGTGGTGAGTGGGTLPQTGIGLGPAILAAVGLLLMLVVVRRLRTS